MFGISITSFLPKYVNCVGKKLIQAFNTQSQLGLIYEGFAKHIIAKYEGPHYLPQLQYQTCSKSPITQTMFMIKRDFEIHIDTTIIKNS